MLPEVAWKVLCLGIMYSNSMLELCSQSELWRLCAGDMNVEVQHHSHINYSKSAKAARQSESSGTEKDPQKTQTLPDP
jgi:hypothetical protein